MQEAGHGDAARVRAFLASLGLESDGAVVRLASVSNEVFRVGTGDDALVVRLPARLRRAADRREELRNADNAARAGLAPEVLHADVERGGLVTRHSDGRALTPDDVQGDDDLIALVGRTLARVHTLPTGAYRFDPIAVIDAHLDDLSDRHDLARHRAARAALPAPAAVELRLCHNDPWPGNIIVRDRTALLVDWEYSGRNDPAWDLADFLVEADVGADAETALLRAYADTDDVDEWRERVRAWRPAVDLLWSLWSVVEHDAGNAADDFMVEADRRLARAERALGG